MTRVRKVRAFQMAQELGLSFKEFQKQAADVGITFASAQSSLEESEAANLLRTLRHVAENSQTTALEPKPAATTESSAIASVKPSPSVETEEKKVEQGSVSKTPPSIKETSATNGVPVTTAASLKNVTKSSTHTSTKDTVAAVELICHHSHTFPGDRVFVCGSLPELGEWEPENAVELDAHEWPHWKASVKLPKGQPFEYKILIKNDHGCFWEIGENRVGVVGENDTLEIESYR